MSDAAFEMLLCGGGGMFVFPNKHPSINTLSVQILPFCTRGILEFSSSGPSERRPTTWAPYTSSSRRTRTGHRPTRATELRLREHRKPGHRGSEIRPRDHPGRLIEQRARDRLAGR